MRGKVILFAGILLTLYRLLPAWQGGPVFSIDAWPLLADSRNLLQNGHAFFFPCQQQVSCYFATWPSLEILAVQTTVAMGIPLTYVAPVLVVATSAVEFIALVSVCHALTKSYWPAAVFLLADSPANMFYAGFKQEMYAMPLVVLALTIIIRRLHNLDTRDATVLSLIALGIIFGHHYSTYILLGALAGPTVYHLLRPNSHLSKGFWISIMSVSILAILYYAAQFNYISTISGYNLSFIITLLSYYLVLSLLAFRKLDNTKSQVRFPWVFSFLALAGVFFAPFIARFLYVPLDSKSLLLEIVVLLPLLPLSSLGLSSLLANDKQKGSLVLFWLVTPLALSIFAIFDGNPVMAYRGYVSLTLPAAILLSFAALWIIRNNAKFNSGRVIALIMLIAISFSAGFYSEMLPIYSPRDVFNGSTWYYPAGNLEVLNDIFANAYNTTFYTDLPTLSYTSMLSYKPVLQAVPQSFSMEERMGLLLLQQYDNNYFYFTGNYANIWVNLSQFNTENVVFRGGSYYVYTGK